MRIPVGTRLFNSIHYGRWYDLHDARQSCTTHHLFFPPKIRPGPRYGSHCKRCAHDLLAETGMRQSPCDGGRVTRWALSNPGHIGTAFSESGTGVSQKPAA
jgi:hypothetical protein